MQDINSETLSQLMDGEWDDLDAANGIRSISEDKQLRNTWARYHMVRDAMRNESVAVDDSFAASISAIVADEPTYSNVASINDGQPVAGVDSSQAEDKTTSPWLTRAGGFAIAASVALATVVGLNAWRGAPESDDALLVADTQSVPSGLDGNVTTISNVQGVVSPQVSLVGNQGTYWVRSEPGRSTESEKRLNMFLSQHIEHAPSADWQGMLPYSRLVGYDEVSTNQ